MNNEAYVLNAFYILTFYTYGRMNATLPPGPMLWNRQVGGVRGPVGVAELSGLWSLAEAYGSSSDRARTVRVPLVVISGGDLHTAPSQITDCKAFDLIFSCFAGLSTPECHINVLSVEEGCCNAGEGDMAPPAPHTMQPDETAGLLRRICWCIPVALRRQVWQMTCG